MRKRTFYKKKKKSLIFKLSCEVQFWTFLEKKKKIFLIKFLNTITNTLLDLELKNKIFKAGNRFLEKIFICKFFFSKSVLRCSF